MPKTNQPKKIGSLNDFTTTPQFDPDTDRITALEKRVSTLEMLLNDVMHQLDKPDHQPKTKRNEKPSEARKTTSLQKSKTPHQNLKRHPQ